MAFEGYENGGTCHGYFPVYKIISVKRLPVFKTLVQLMFIRFVREEMAQDDCSSHCLNDEKYSEGHNKKRIGRSVIFSFAVNVFFLGVVFCWVVLQIVGDHQDNRDDLQGPSPAPSLREDSFYSCSPCKPMTRADDADTMRLATGNSSFVCCKRISPDVQLELPNTGQLLEECQAKQGL
eukprot:XP_011412108.2 PREDICTED: uncharacterized protein LOC105317222 [Crassostrea gigas]